MHSPDWPTQVVGPKVQSLPQMASSWPHMSQVGPLKSSSGAHSPWSSQLPQVPSSPQTRLPQLPQGQRSPGSQEPRVAQVPSTHHSAVTVQSVHCVATVPHSPSWLPTRHSP